ncbi:16705_t:CDS:2 [Funneliformis geosporum]|uniref:16705_t:CDS:1 n=1 Tax=Funneliformis geosporum TaxID=1117311 RepID=A0A9W4T1B9_9GLOM|nr:16705_t:CDS:2 [Funneliformis geosporum]
MVNLKDALRYVLQESSCLGLQLKMGGKDEKNFEKRVKQYVKLLKGKRLKSVIPTGNQPFEFVLVGFEEFKSLLICEDWALLVYFLVRVITFGRCDVRDRGLQRIPFWAIRLISDTAKPEETLVEARSGSDVQIDRQIWWAIFDTTKGVSSSRQQDGGHGSWNPLRTLRVILSGTTFSADLGVSSKYSNENFED